MITKSLKCCSRSFRRLTSFPITLPRRSSRCWRGRWDPPRISSSKLEMCFPRSMESRAGSQPSANRLAELEGGGGGRPLMQKCAFIKKGGSRCGAPAMKGFQYCWGHRPDLAEERKRAASRAGKAGGRGRPKVEPKDRLGQVFVTCEYLIPALLESRIDTRTAAAVTQASHLLLRAIETSLKI